MNRAILFSTGIALLGLVGSGLAAQKEKGQQAKEELRVDLNRASVEELVKLPGVGQQVAKRIAAYREERGPFQKLEELMNVRGIGEKTFLKLQPYLTLGGEQDPRKK